MDKKDMGKPYLTPSHSRFASRWIFLTILTCLLFVDSPLSAKSDPEKLVYRLKWLKNVSTAGDLYAHEAGLFLSAGLAVTIKDGGPERDAVKELELGYAQFGVASADQVIRAVTKGAPVVVIAQIFQVNPLQWIYHDDEAPIETPESLKGKTIGITFGGNDETIMRTLLSVGGISEREVHFFSVRYDYTPFYNRSVTLWPVYRNAQAIVLNEKLKTAGKGIRVLEPERFGIRFVANSVITSIQMLKSRPDTVRRFVSVLLKGWGEAIKPVHQEEVLRFIHPFDRDTPMAILEKQLEATRQMVQPDSRIPIGTIDSAAWEQTAQIMRDQGIIRDRIDMREVLQPLDVSGNMSNR